MLSSDTSSSSDSRPTSSPPAIPSRRTASAAPLCVAITESRLLRPVVKAFGHVAAGHEGDRQLGPVAGRIELEGEGVDGAGGLERPERAAHDERFARRRQNHLLVLDGAVVGQGLSEAPAGLGVEREVGGIAGEGVGGAPPGFRPDQCRIDFVRRSRDVRRLAKQVEKPFADTVTTSAEAAKGQAIAAARRTPINRDEARTEASSATFPSSVSIRLLKPRTGFQGKPHRGSGQGVLASEGGAPGQAWIKRSLAFG